MDGDFVVGAVVVGVAGVTAGVVSCSSLLADALWESERMTERAFSSSARRSLMVICASASLSAQIPATNELSLYGQE